MTDHTSGPVKSDVPINGIIIAIGARVIFLIVVGDDSLAVVLVNGVNFLVVTKSDLFRRVLDRDLSGPRRDCNLACTIINGNANVGVGGENGVLLREHCE